MTPATWSALLLLAAGLIHSFSLMCRKLPPKRRPTSYPSTPPGRGAIDLVWIVLFLTGIRLAFSLSLWLGIVAAIIYFVALPFVFQPSLARMLGFRNLRDYLDTVDREQSS
jgi:hypothetical protein